MGTMVFIGLCLFGMYFCFYMFGKTLNWVFHPVIKYLEVKENAEQYVSACSANEESEQAGELLHEEHVMLEDESTIIHITKLVMKKLNNEPLEDDDIERFRR